MGWMATQRFQCCPAHLLRKVPQTFRVDASPACNRATTSPQQRLTARTRSTSKQQPESEHLHRKTQNKKNTYLRTHSDERALVKTADHWN
ncbi:hypothetical protein BDP55DRAFT_678015 [Colletotrichum godetiae]|uniref:Uncharacterized protein n=1 Tax=Colletotrichum godetiae TaxID=1209918 RepID=A0AAJ0AE46_9PEZI|nr:uncharacterized protein BDP55DRAFT_678015 [Colletotrichum godetiae]KAK1660022.1 hypothetical protein BDP55DRAFT_678015 [Colletotrichum godetiae]